MSDKLQVEPSRRQLLTGAGAAGAGLVAASIGGAPAAAAMTGAAHGAAVARHERHRPGAPVSSNLFGRLFPGLRPFAEPGDKVRAALEVGGQGGIMDAGDDLAAGPKALIVDPAVNGNPTAADPYGTNPDNPTMTAAPSSGSSSTTTSPSTRPLSSACRRIR